VTVRVLIVDDQAAFRRAAARVLARQPEFELVGEAESGEASIEATLTLRPDLILMDVHMPGIGGAEATRRIMASSGPDPPVVMLLSTYDVADYGSRALECGAAAYLPKAEFGPDVLRAAWMAARPAEPKG
jgi:DNA-binding NarL/FixJ family response regulator